MAWIKRSMGDVQFWISLSLGFLMVFVVIFAFIARKPLCIDSRIVERIDSISSEGTASAYRCGLHKHVDYNEKLALEIKDLGRRLQVLEKYFEWMGGLQSRVSLTVINDSNNFYRIQDHQIFIGDGFIKASGQLEKTLLKVWVLERAHESLAAQPLLIESLTDLLYFSLSGDFAIQEPLSGLRLDQALQARWPRVLNDFSAYCQSLWRSNEDISRCERETQVEPENQMSRKADMLSLRPLLTESLISAYRKLKPVEQMQWISDFSRDLQNQKVSHQILSNEDMIDTFIELLSSSQQLTHFFNQELESRGFKSKNQESPEYLVFVDDLKSDWLKQLEQANQKNSIVMEYKGNQISNEKSAIQIKNANPLTAETGIMVQCGDINFDKIKDVSKRVKKLLYIKSCEEESIDILSYFEKGAAGLAAKNKDLQFIEFHTPSLRLALRRTPSLDNVKSIQSQNIQARLFDYLGWQKPEFDILLKAYRAKSVIEAVDWYRL